jgi:hypothetical protein
MVLKNLACGTVQTALACETAPPRRVGAECESLSQPETRRVNGPDRDLRTRGEQGVIDLLGGLISQIVLTKLPKYD